MSRSMLRVLLRDGFYGVQTQAGIPHLKGMAADTAIFAVVDDNTNSLLIWTLNLEE
jgi:hypothetical protein